MLTIEAAVLVLLKRRSYRLQDKARKWTSSRPFWVYVEAEEEEEGEGDNLGEASHASDAVRLGDEESECDSEEPRRSGRAKIVVDKASKQAKPTAAVVQPPFSPVSFTNSKVKSPDTRTKPGQENVGEKNNNSVALDGARMLSAHR